MVAGNLFSVVNSWYLRKEDRLEISQKHPGPCMTQADKNLAGPHRCALGLISKWLEVQLLIPGNYLASDSKMSG